MAIAIVLEMEEEELPPCPASPKRETESARRQAGGIVCISLPRQQYFSRQADAMFASKLVLYSPSWYYTLMWRVGPRTTPDCVVRS